MQLLKFSFLGPPAHLATVFVNDARRAKWRGKGASMQKFVDQEKPPSGVSPRGSEIFGGLEKMSMTARASETPPKELGCLGESQSQPG